ncbi:MAG: hypothetical protein H0T97_01930 [Actinobacteria bacterium]|nr:hypothetical protein [Actinomycetota bacterium]
MDTSQRRVDGNAVDQRPVELASPQEALVFRLGDWVARGAVAGLAAGLAFLLAEMGWATRAGLPGVAPMLDMSTIFHGTDAPTMDPALIPGDVVIGLITHLNLSLAFGIAFALLTPFFRNWLVLLGAGLAYGIVLYVVNIQILGRFVFEWFTSPMIDQSFQLFIHAVFGLLLVPFFLGTVTRLRASAAQ